jgi:hypothetical protein
VLALALGGRTIAEWQAVMSEREKRAWIDFYALYPFDDLHRIHRPAAMVSASLGGGEIQKRLDWLQPSRATGAGRYSEADMKTMRALGFTGRGE